MYSYHEYIAKYNNKNKIVIKLFCKHEKSKQKNTDT